MRTERPWTEAELAELTRLKTRTSYTWDMIAHALERGPHGVKARWRRLREGRSVVKVPAAPKPRCRPGPRPGTSYRALEKALATGRAHPVVLALCREIVEKRLSPCEISRKAGISNSRIQEWGHGANPGLTLLDAALTVAGFRLTVERIDDETSPKR